MTTPKIRISYAWLLANAASGAMNEKWGDGSPLKSDEYYEQVAKKYEDWWRPHNDTILEGIQQITGLRFNQNIIDIHVAPWFYAFSSPLVIGVIFKTEDDIIRVISHELIHRLLTDNTSHPDNFDYVSQWQDLFGNNHDHATLVHIPVHAVLSELFTNILKRPDLIDADKASVAKNKPYSDAWDYVEEAGSDNIIKLL